MDTVIGLVMFLALILLGLIAGGAAERAHFTSLAAREQATRGFLLTQTRRYLDIEPGGPPPQMLMAEVVIASDYLKSFLASLRNLFGGEVKSYQTLLERARREATLRIVEQARRQGYNAICNLRLETADIGGNFTGKGAAMVAIIASATAYRARS